jgi:hypothetical protein
MPEIPATQEAEISRIMVIAQHSQKVSKTPISTNNQTWWYTPVITTVQEA